jgi:uncharacterized protein (DUF2147 family)
MTQALVVRRFFVLITMLFVSFARAESATVQGRWLTSQSVIQVRDCGGQLCGVIEQLLLPERIDQSQLLDVKNKDRRLRDRPMLGMNLLMDFGALVPGQTRYPKGRVYHPDHGRDYRASLTLISPDQLEIEGCVFAFCQSEQWSRLPPCEGDRCPID